MRSLAASVAITLRKQALIQLDAYEVENWLEEAGLSIKLTVTLCLFTARYWITLRHARWIDGTPVNVGIVTNYERRWRATWVPQR